MTAMTPDKVEAALASFAALIEKKRRQADMADHPKANEYGRGAASAMRVVSDEMADELMSLTSVLTEALAERERDAARYRWLVANKSAAVSSSVNNGIVLYRAENIDAAIDAAMKETP